MRPITISTYLQTAEDNDFIPTVEGLHYYEEKDDFIELKEVEEVVVDLVVEEETVEVVEEVVVEEKKTFLNENVKILIQQIREVELQGFTKDQAIEIVRLSYNI